MSHIETNKNILAGKPVIKGTRISVELILQLLSQGKDIDYILDQYPQVKKADILACIDYARNIVAGEDIEMLNLSFA